MTQLRIGDSERLWVEDTGGAEMPVVLLHPGITDSTIWDRLRPLLEGVRLIAVDAPGYGRSARASVASRPVDDLLGVLDALGVERAHLVGNSMGGGTALALAGTHPDRVASLMLLCAAVPGFPWPDDAGDAEIEAEFERLSGARDVDGLTELYLQVFAACGTDDYLREQVRATTVLELSGADLAEPNPAQWEHAGSMRVPTTIVIGERDDPDTTYALEALARRIPDATVVRLNTDHLPQYREPAEVARLVLATIGTHPG